MLPFKLVQRRGPASGRSFPLASGVTWLGRAPDAPVPLATPHASPRHAELEVTPNGVLLRNLDMQLGTRVGGYKVHVMLLAEGQLIEIGDEAFELRAEVGEPRGSVVCIRGPSTGKTFQVTDYAITMGRIVEAQIILYTQRASRRHAEIRPLADGVHVVDLGSGNGTFVNGHRISDKLLQPGDVIEIGEEQFRFDEPTARAVPSPLAVSGLDFGSGEVSISPKADSRPTPYQTKSGTLQMSAKPHLANGPPSAPVSGVPSTVPQLGVNVTCPACGRVVDARYGACPWDGAALPPPPRP